MIGYHRADDIRAAEAATGPLLTGGVLMRRASAGVASVVLAELRARCGRVYGARVGLVIGTGDNGGDALYAGARLARRGVVVHAVLIDPDRVHRAAATAFTEAGGRMSARLPDRCDLVIDGVVGLGGSGPLRRSAAAVFADVTAPIVAVDLPSGVDADTGVVHHLSVHAAVTVTFGVRRRAHILAAPACGRVEVIDIGIGDQIDTAAASLAALTDREVGAMWPVPGPTDDKYTQGVVGVIAGSQRYPGAAVLSVGAAVAATSGMVRYVGSAAVQVVSAHPEVVVAPDVESAGRVQAWVIGPGAGADDAAAATLHRVLATDVPVLVDADAITVLAAHPEWVRARTAPTLLTPHAGEFARLAGPDALAAIAADRVGAVQALAADLGATVLLKGRVTVIADATDRTLVNDAETSWAATAGAGDVLSGLAGALLAAGHAPTIAGAAAARVHARAAALAAAGAPIGASNLLAAVAPAIRAIRTVGQ